MIVFTGNNLYCGGCWQFASRQICNSQKGG